MDQKMKEVYQKTGSRPISAYPTTGGAATVKNLLSTGERLQVIRFHQASEIQQKKARLYRKEYAKENHVR